MGDVSSPPQIRNSAFMKKYGDILAHIHTTDHFCKTFNRGGLRLFVQKKRNSITPARFQAPPRGGS